MPYVGQLLQDGGKTLHIPGNFVREVVLVVEREKEDGSKDIFQNNFKGEIGMSHVLRLQFG